MFKYQTPTGTFDIVKNMGCRAGDGLVRMGPDTNCEWVCEDIADDGLIPTHFCNGLDQCVLDPEPVPCIGEVSECGPCNGGGSNLTDIQLAQIAESPVVTTVIEQIAVDCSAAEIAGAAAAKAGG